MTGYWHRRYDVSYRYLPTSPKPFFIPAKADIQSIGVVDTACYHLGLHDSILRCKPAGFFDKQGEQGICCTAQVRVFRPP